MSLTLGVDIDSYSIHVAAVPDDGTAPSVVSAVLRKKGDDEHRAIQSVAQALATACREIKATRVGVPVLGAGGTMYAELVERIDGVWVERGFGASRKADFILGCIYGAVIVACGHVLPGVACRQMQAADWKREVTGECGITTKTGGRGNGNVKKDIANDCVRQIYAEHWPLAIVPTDPNQLDAFGVAYAASKL